MRSMVLCCGVAMTAVLVTAVPPATAQSASDRTTVEVAAPPLTAEQCARLAEKSRKSCEDRLREQRKQQVRAATHDVPRQGTRAQRQVKDAGFSVRKGEQ